MGKEIKQKMKLKCKYYNEEKCLNKQNRDKHCFIDKISSLDYEICYWFDEIKTQNINQGETK